MPAAELLATDPPGLFLLRDAGFVPIVAVAAMLLATALVLFVVARRSRPTGGAVGNRVDRRLAWPVPGAGLVMLLSLLACMSDNELLGVALVTDRAALPLVLGAFALLGFVGLWLLALIVSRADVR